MFLKISQISQGNTPNIKKPPTQNSQNLQGNTCAGVFFIEKEILAQVFPCEFYEIFKSTFFAELLWTTVCKIHSLIWITVPANDIRICYRLMDNNNLVVFKSKCKNNEKKTFDIQKKPCLINFKSLQDWNFFLNNFCWKYVSQEPRYKNVDN